MMHNFTNDLIFDYVDAIDYYFLLVGFGRACAPVTRLFEISATPNGALRAPPPPPMAASLLLI
jgi:hypothetical protein